MASGTIKSNSWKLLGEKTGTSSFTLPSNFSELLIVINPSASSIFVPINIPIADLSGTPKMYRIGYYSTSSYNNGSSINVSTSSAQLAQVYMNGADVTSTTKCKIYYR